VGRTDRLGIDARQPYRRGAQGDRRQRPGTAPDPNDRPHRIPVRRRGREGRPSVGSSSAIAGAANANQASAHALVLPAELGITPPLWRLIEGPAQGAHPGRSSGARPGASRARWRSMTSARQPQAQDRTGPRSMGFPGRSGLSEAAGHGQCPDRREDVSRRSWPAPATSVSPGAARSACWARRVCRRDPGASDRKSWR
jgi:hypothetical protein